MTDPTPYQSSAVAYADAGWHPIPMTSAGAGGKGVPLSGYTGYSGARVTPEAARILVADAALALSHPNVSLRMVGTVGLDVDAYDGRDGAATMNAAQADLGLLPPTYYSTSRGAGASGIRIYRLPVGMEVTQSEVRNIGKYGGNVEVIREAHRYVKCWPTVHPAGGTYSWYHPSGAPIPPGQVPRLEDVPELPPSWVQFMCVPKPAEPRAREPRRGESRKDYPDDAFGPDYSPRPVTVVRATEIMHAAIDRLRSAQDGKIRVTAYGSAKTLGRFVGNLITRSEAEDLLHEAIGHTVYDGATWQAETPIGDGLDVGESDPREIVAESDPRAEGKACNSAGGGEYPDPIPEEFWSARPVLSHLRLCALSGTASPESVLAVALVTVLAHVMPHVVLPKAGEKPGRSGRPGGSSLNMLLAIMAPSGVGKDTALEVTSDGMHIDTPQPPKACGIGSGEGIGAKFVERVKIDPEDKKEKPVLAMTNYLALATVSESDTMEKLAERAGNTLLPEVRKAAMGQRLGFDNADPSRNYPVEPGTYRYVAIVAAQPTKIGWLINDNEGGTPQRFLWAFAGDPDAPAPVDDVEWPGRFTIKISKDALPDLFFVGRPVYPPRLYAEHIKLPVCPDAVDVIRAGRHANLTMQGDAEESHSNFTRLKVAAALGLMDGRLDVSSSDWMLSGYVMDHSRATREWVKRVLAVEQDRKNEGIGRARGKQNHVAKIAEVVAEDGLIDEAAQWALKAICAASPEWLAHGDLTRACPKRLRPFLDAGTARLDDLGSALVEPYTAASGRPAKRYRKV